MVHNVLFLGPAHEHGKKARIAVWVLAVLVAIQFLLAGGLKLVGGEAERDNFQRWGYPDWFRIVVGAGEVLAAILVLVPQTRFWTASALVFEMLGALVTHARIGEWAMVGAPVFPLVLCAALAWLERPERLRRQPKPGTSPASA